MNQPDFKQFANRFTRIFYFTQKGLGLFDVFKNLILVIIALSFTLKLTGILPMVGIFMLALPIMTVVGWFCVHYMDKVVEWLQISYGTHYAKKQFSIYEEILETLKRIESKL